MLFKVQIDRGQPQYVISTEVKRNTPWRQESLGTQSPPAETHAKWKKEVRTRLQISKHQLIGRGEN